MLGLGVAHGVSFGLWACQTTPHNTRAQDGSIRAGSATRPTFASLRPAEKYRSRSDDDAAGDRRVGESTAGVMSPPLVWNRNGSTFPWLRRPTAIMEACHLPVWCPTATGVSENQRLSL